LRIPPLVLIGTEEVTIESCLFRALSRCVRAPKERSSKVYSLLNQLAKIVRSANLLDKVGDLMDQYLRELAEEYNSGKPAHILESFDTILTAKQCEVLLRWWFKHRCLRKLYLLGLTLTDIRETEMRPSVLFNQAFENPYSIASIDLNKCDHIYNIQGKKPTEDQYKAGQVLRYVYSSCKEKHWSYFPIEELEKRFPSSVLGIPFLQLLEREYNLLFLSSRLYLKGLYDLENEIFNIYHSTGNLRSPEAVFKIVNGLPDHLSLDQKDAIQLILSNKWSILTGPAGSGKTTILQTLIDILINENKTVLVVAFTGKAVARIIEVVGSSTMACVCTIHRFLASFDNDTPKYDHVFIDETSMVNLPLFGKLVHTLRKDFSLTLIGDNRQLYPINWSSIFDALILSEKIPHAKLEKVHRTSEAENNGIYINAMKVRNRKPDESLSLVKTDNFQMIPGSISTVTAVVNAIVSAGRKLESLVIICPFNKYLDDLNNIVRKHLPNGPSVTDRIQKKNWKVGDRVMMLKNSYDLGIMNGEEGKVVSIGSENISILFDKFTNRNPSVNQVDNQNTGIPQEKIIEFNLDDNNDDVILDDESFTGDPNTKFLCHSFAITIHKSQGDERDLVILFIPPESVASEEFINKRLLYTAITRAKKGIFIIGNISAFLNGLVTEDPIIYESLSELFQSRNQTEKLI